MSSDAVLKKTLFGGFKKSNVIDYIEQIQKENCSLKNELQLKETATSELDGLQKEYELLKAKYDEQSKIAEELQNKNDSLMTINAEYSVKLEEKNADAQKASVALANAETKYNELVNDYNQLSGDKANAVIKDAMKYADSLVAAAKESAAQILAKANNAISSASSEISDANVRVKTAQSNLNYSLDSVQSGVESLLNNLSKYAGELRGD